MYLARDHKLKKRWCVKIARPSKGLKLQCELEHERLPQVVDYWEEEGVTVVVMAYIEGISLEEMLKQGRISERKALLWSQQLLQVVDYLQQQSPPVIHGDLKPKNLQISREEDLYLLDFGCADNAGGDQVKTRRGTSGYAAPEQRQGQCILESDMYAVGRILEQLWKNVGGSRKLYRVLRKCQNSKPEKRYGDCQSLEKALQPCFTKMEKAASSERLWLVFLGLLIMLGVGVSLNGKKEMLEKGKEEVKQEKIEQRKDRENQTDGTEIRTQVRAYYQMPPNAWEKQQCFVAIRTLGFQLLQESGDFQGRKELLLLAQMCEAEGDEMGAEAFYRAYIESKPEDFDGTALYGLWLLEKGRRIEAVALWENKKESFPGEQGHNWRIWKERMEQEVIKE